MGASTRPDGSRGCSGWQYAHRRGDFYAAELPTSRWFAHYALTFDTVEINNSFYRLPAGREIFLRALPRPACHDAFAPGFMSASASTPNSQLPNFNPRADGGEGYGLGIW